MMGMGNEHKRQVTVRRIDDEASGHSVIDN